jgi:hypothetical protein
MGFYHHCNNPTPRLHIRFTTSYSIPSRESIIQSHNIDMLQGNIHNLQQANSHLIDQLQIEHSKIQDSTASTTSKN